MSCYQSYGNWEIDNETAPACIADKRTDPTGRGAVICELPLMFGDSIVIRDKSTIGRPCPTVDDWDKKVRLYAETIAVLPRLVAAIERGDMQAARRVLLLEPELVKGGLGL